MLNKKLPTTLPQTFCEIIFNFQVIIKSIKDLDENFKSNSSISGAYIWSDLYGNIFKNKLFWKRIEWKLLDL